MLIFLRLNKQNLYRFLCIENYNFILDIDVTFYQIKWKNGKWSMPWYLNFKCIMKHVCNSLRSVAVMVYIGDSAIFLLKTGDSALHWNSKLVILQCNTIWNCWGSIWNSMHFIGDSAIFSLKTVGAFTFVCYKNKIEIKGIGWYPWWWKPVL